MRAALTGALLTKFNIITEICFQKGKLRRCPEVARSIDTSDDLGKMLQGVAVSHRRRLLRAPGCAVSHFTGSNTFMVQNSSCVMLLPDALIQTL